MRSWAAAALFAPTLVLTLVVTAGSALAQPQAPSDAPTLDSILSRFAALPGLEARFVEEKTMAMLAVPVRSEGQIYFAGNPARLMRRVTAPDPSQALIAGGELRMRSGGRTETISIAGNPVLRGFVDSFREFETGGGHYTWWSNRPGVRERNVGWRIDYFLVSGTLRPRLVAAGIRADVLGSDHCPITLDLA